MIILSNYRVLHFLAGKDFNSPSPTAFTLQVKEKERRGE
jgi:hypothetical protein